MDDMKIVRMTNWMKKARNREVWHILVKEANSNKWLKSYLKKKNAKT